MKLATNYNAYVQDESKKTAEELVVDRVGKQDPKRHLESSVTDLMTSNIDQCLGTMLDTVVFWAGAANKSFATSYYAAIVLRVFKLPTQIISCYFIDAWYILYEYFSIILHKLKEILLSHYIKIDIN